MNGMMQKTLTLCTTAIVLLVLLACSPFASLAQEERAEDEVRAYREKVIEKIVRRPSYFEALSEEAQQIHLLTGEVIKANADWLMCDMIGSRVQVSYTFHYVFARSGKGRALKAAGRYDRGVHFVTPSELSIFGFGPGLLSHYTIEECVYEGTEALKLSCEVNH